MPKDLKEQQKERVRLRRRAIANNSRWTDGAYSFSLLDMYETHVIDGKWREDNETGLSGYVSDGEVLGALIAMINKSLPQRHTSHSKDTFELLTSGDSWHYYHSEPTRIGHLVYIDIRSAYYSIYSKVRTWDLSFLPPGSNRESKLGNGVMPFPKELLEFVGDNKGLRAALIGMTGATSTTIFYPNMSFEVKQVRGTANYPLTLFVLLYLQAAMAYTHQCINKSCVYAHTDGMIVKYQSYESAIQAFYRWGLEARIKDIDISGSVKYIGAYKVGKYQSKPYALAAFGSQYHSEFRDMEDVVPFLHKYAKRVMRFGD